MNDYYYRKTSSNVYTVKEICSRWYHFQLNKIEKAWVWAEILCLDFEKTRSNQYIKSSKLATFKNCEIFSNLYFSYIRDYKATLSDGNKTKRIQSTILYIQYLGKRRKLKHTEIEVKIIIKIIYTQIGKYFSSRYEWYWRIEILFIFMRSSLARN